MVCFKNLNRLTVCYFLFYVNIVIDVDYIVSKLFRYMSISLHKSCLKKGNVMSSVPLMTLHNSKPGSDETYDSDQLSDEEEYPLESVIARMKYRYDSLFYIEYKCMPNK